MRIRNLKELERCNLSPEATKQIRTAFNAKTKDGNRNTDTVADNKQIVRNELAAKDENTTFDTPVSIDIYPTTKTKTDIDNISAKAAIDAIVAAKILSTDSPDQVERYTVHKPTISKEEKTVIVIEEIIASVPDL